MINLEDDLGLRKMLGCSIQIGWTHVHGNSLDLHLINSMLAQCLGKGPKRLGTASFDRARLIEIQARPFRRIPLCWNPEI